MSGIKRSLHESGVSLKPKMHCNCFTHGIAWQFCVKPHLNATFWSQDLPKSSLHLSFQSYVFICRRKNSFINRLTLSLHELSEEFIPRGIAWNIWDIIMKMKKRHRCILRVSKYYQYLGNKSKVNFCSFVYYCTLEKQEGEQHPNCVNTESKRDSVSKHSWGSLGH